MRVVSRDLPLGKDRNTVRFSDVAALIDPTTVSFASVTDPAGTHAPDPAAPRDGLVMRFARPPAMELALVDLNRTVSETLRFLEMELAYRGISLKAKLHPTPLPILADEKLLKQALLNLLLNAQEAVEKEEKTIRVTTGVRGARPFVRIRDNGRGIPASDRRHIFRLFFTTRKSGSGLGLPIVRQIVRQHGGTVYVRSREGQGTTMTVALLFEEQFRAMFPGRLPLALPQGARR